MCLCPDYVPNHLRYHGSPRNSSSASNLSIRYRSRSSVLIRRPRSDSRLDHATASASSSRHPSLKRPSSLSKVLSLTSPFSIHSRASVGLVAGSEGGSLFPLLSPEPSRVGRSWVYANTPPSLKIYAKHS